jgi:potassium efflux system protein
MLRIGWIVGIVCCLAGTSLAFAQTEKTAPRDNKAQSERAPAELSAEAIQKRLKQVESATNLDESVRKSLIEKYNTALAHLKTAEEHKQAAAEFREKTDAAPQELERLQEALKGPPPDVLPAIEPEMGLAEMQEALSKSEQIYETLQKERTEYENEPARRADRRTAIPPLLESIRNELEEIEKQSGVTAPGGATLDPAAVAERVLLIARRHALEHELQVYEEELRHYELTVDLIEARRDHSVMVSEHAEQHLKAWRAAVNERRQKDAVEQAQAAQAAARHAHPAIRRLAEENAALSLQREDLAGRIEIASRELEAIQDQLKMLAALYDRLHDRVERVGLTESIGVVLRKQRESIPDASEHQRFIDERKAEISRLSLQVLDLEDQSEALADIDERARHIHSEARHSRHKKKQLSLAEIRKTLESSRDIVHSLIADTNNYIELLTELDTKETELVGEARKFSEFTREYILWIRSTEVPGAGDVKQLQNACVWLLAPRQWSTVIQEVVTDVRSHAAAWLGALATFVVLALSPRLWRRLLRKAGRDAAQRHATSVFPTALALLTTVVLSAAWPAALWLVGWRIGRLTPRSDFLMALHHGLQGAAFLLGTLNFTRHLCRSHGLGEAHFEWPKPVLELVRKNLWWMTVAGLPLAAIVLVTEAQGDEAIKNSLGRMAFIAFQLLLLSAAHQVWHAPQGLARQLASGERHRWWLRICRLGHIASIVAPVALVALAVAGYYYTAVQLAQRLLVTSWLAGGLLVVHATLLRWVLLAYRDLATKRGREQREAAADHHSAAEAEEATVQLSGINQQIRQLLGLAICGAFLIGCSVIWVEILPAFEFLDTVQVWPHPFAKFDPDAKKDPKEFVLLLGDVAAAVLLLLVTTAAARNIPGLIEIAILRHLKLDAGARFAIEAITQYAITVLGCSLAFSRVGVGWEDVQWLAAAMTVGLGFGLQEIFANFASGLLLLFERPIRVGDTVTVGDTTGTVTRIRIRATTIVDGDLRELIVPNREFISGKVMNWTLTDTTTRMTINIAVPRGNDPNAVRQLLLRVATKHPMVLKDPPPNAMFDEFSGDNLKFTLRVFMANRDVYDQLRHELNAGLDAAFHQAGIDRSQPPMATPVSELPHAA